MSFTRHTSYSTTIFRDGASVVAEFCMKEGLPWPCDTEERDRLLAEVVQQRDLAEARLGDLRAALKAADDLATLAAAIHRWNEEHHEAGCVHFDKGYGPYAQCEDEGLDVPRGVFLPDGLQGEPTQFAGIVWHERYDKAAATIATLRAALDGLVEAAEAVVASAESYSSEDRWGIYPLDLFAETAALRAALVAYVATCSAESDQQVSATKEATK